MLRLADFDVAADFATGRAGGLAVLHDDVHLGGVRGLDELRAAVDGRVAVVDTLDLPNLDASRPLGSVFGLVEPRGTPRIFDGAGVRTAVAVHVEVVLAVVGDGVFQLAVGLAELELEVPVRTVPVLASLPPPNVMEVFSSSSSNSWSLS